MGGLFHVHNNKHRIFYPFDFNVQQLVDRRKREAVVCVWSVAMASGMDERTETRGQAPIDVINYIGVFSIASTNKSTVISKLSYFLSV